MLDNLLRPWYGRFIGSLFGLMLAGVFGLVIGFLAGYLFDRGWAVVSETFNPTHTQQVQHVFFNATFSVMGHIAKADGRVSEHEIQAARQIMNRLGLNEIQRQQAITSFNNGKQAEFNLQATLQELKQQCGHQRTLLQLFAEFQLQAATADGSISPHKTQLLQQMYQSLGLGVNFNWSIFEHFFTAQQNGQQHYHYQNNFNRQPQTTTLEEAYRTLGIAQTASATDIKKAYRKLMSQNHPDKLVAKGLPEEMIKLATEKTQKIQAAYEQICKARGI